MPIHSTAIISDHARVAEDVEIGPYCVVDDHVELASGCVLHSHVCLQGPSKFGQRNIFHPFCSIGGKTQDLKYTAEPTYLRVGDDNEFREFVTVNRGTAVGEETVIGSRNHFLAYSHVAHNCVVGNDCILSNNGTLGGHVVVGDFVVVGGLAAVHQFCRIGKHAMVGGCTKIVQDVPPYCIADGNPALVRTINAVGLQRRHFPEATLRELRHAVRIFYDSSLNTTQALNKIRAEHAECAEVQDIIRFVETSQRGVIR